MFTLDQKKCLFSPTRLEKFTIKEHTMSPRQKKPLIQKKIVKEASGKENLCVLKTDEES